MRFETFLAIFCVPLVCWAAGPLPAPFTEKCIVGIENRYPPKEAAVPWFTIDLDKKPIDRWTEVATKYTQEIKDLIQVIKNLEYPLFHGKLVKWVDEHMIYWDNRMPQPYQDEMRGIANVTGINLGEIVLYNIFYEINALCTSIVAEDPTGKLYHARNLDFGLFLGWDYKNHDWALTPKLRKIIINLEWKKNGRTLYKSVNFAGFIGIYNALKQNKFTVTANERYSFPGGGYDGIWKWILGDDSLQWMTWLTRQTMEQANNYRQAVNMLATTKLMSPVYFIVGGSKSGEGVIISRGMYDEADNRTQLEPNKPNGWYILETNYDHSLPPLFIDDRRTPGNKCMRILGQSGVGFEGIFNVLSSTTNLNKLTAYTVLMQVNSGQFETYIQNCPQPCWPW